MNNLEIVNALLDTTAIDVNLRDKNRGNRPLVVASQEGYLNIVKSLLHIPHIDVNMKRRRGFTPLVAACLNGHLGVVRVLLQRNDILINTIHNGYDRMPPAVFNIQQKPHRNCSCLLERLDIDVNLANGLGESSLSYAVRVGNLDAAKMILGRQDIEINSADRYGRTALYKPCITYATILFGFCWKEMQLHP